jgi:hypothetical protein
VAPGGGGFGQTPYGFRRVSRGAQALDTGRTGSPGPTDAERSEARDYERTAARARAALTSADRVEMS